jgi:quercetin dioxygenase-like cupin family protein
MTIIRREDPTRSQRLFNADSGAQHLSAGIAVFEPGRAIPLHTHDVEELVFILSGEATCVLEDGVRVLHAHDASYVPAGTPHCFRNDSDAPMTFLYTYAGVNVERHVVEGKAD